MSEGYAREASLVNEGSNGYDRMLDGTIALCVLTSATALLALVEVVPLDATGGALGGFFRTVFAAIAGGVGVVALASWANVVPVTSRRIRGVAVGLVASSVLLTAAAYALPVNLATLLGLALLTEAGVVVGAGVASRTGVVDTEPDRSAGLLAGVTFAAIGLALGSALAGSLVGFGSPVWIVGAVVVAVALFVATVLPQEDVGSTLPVALIVGTLGLVVATAAIGVGWQWNPDALSGGFTGGAVIPVFVLFGTLLSAWSAAKCRAGFGAPGREYGAFLVINLNALLMVAVMVTIVLFVASRGIAYGFHGFTIGALSALVLLAPVFAVVTEFARTPAGSSDWHTGARELFRAVPLAATGAVAALLTTVLVTGRELSYGYIYVVQVDRSEQPLETAVSVTPEPAVGALVLVVPALVLFAALFRRYGSLRNVGEWSGRIRSLQQTVPVAVAVLAVLTGVLVLGGPSPLGVPLGGTVGAVAVGAGAFGAAALAALPLAALATRNGSLAERAVDGAPLFTIGVFGGLGLLAAALFLQAPAQVAPSLGPVNVVPAVGMLAAVLSLAAAGAAAVARRRTGETIQQRLLGEETVLGLAGVAGFLALVGLHVSLTGTSFTVLGVSVTTEGTLSWPMTMQAYIPLGAEPGGIMPAVVGTVWLVIGATLFAVPLGVGAAVFLTEYAEQGGFTSTVEIATNALWSTPSIVFGLFGAAFIIPRTGGDESLLAGMLVLGFMLLPLVLITSREAIKAVPDEYRDASAALGVSRWETIRSVVLPAAMPGVITGVILGVGRIAGETAPLILVLGSTLNATESANVLQGFSFQASPPFVTNPELLQASASLPTQVWGVIAAGVSGSPQMGWATAFVLLMVVLSFYAAGITARTYFRRKLNYE